MAWIRTLLLVLWGSTLVWAKPTGPQVQVPVPAGWFSPAPDRWSAPDGGLSLCWEVTPLKGPPEAAARQALSRFPGKLRGGLEPMQLDGQPGWQWTGEYQGRLHRVVFSSHNNRAITLVFTCLPQQGFALVACLDEVLRGFRWLGAQTETFCSVAVILAQPVDRPATFNPFSTSSRGVPGLLESDQGKLRQPQT